MSFQKAQRKQAKLRLALSGPSGSGKTYSALLIAQGLAPQGRIALDWLMPELLRLVVASREPARLFERVCTLLTRIFTRSAYLQLLAENPAALRQLVRLCDESNLVS